MYKVSYMGNGSSTEFYFNFPFFQEDDIIVSINGEPTTSFNVIGTPGGLDADFPFISGRIVFETAPRTIDSITISRYLALERIVDHQATAKISTKALNQDANYLLELVKDRKDELDDLATKYSEIADKESTETILARIQAIHDEIIALGDVSQIRSDVSDLKTTTTSQGTTISNNTTNINTLDTRTSGLIDYVIESQAPIAENNYTWYRKYKSGWVEQGGYCTGNTSCTLPISMQTPDYTLCFGFINNEATTNNHLYGKKIYERTQTSFTIKTTYDGRAFDYTLCWHICGFSGQ